MKICPDCGEDLDVDISPDFSEVVCYNCGFFVMDKFATADDAFRYIEEGVF